jgi:hypothetical protein
MHKQLQPGHTGAIDVNGCDTQSLETSYDTVDAPRRTAHGLEVRHNRIELVPVGGGHHLDQRGRARITVEAIGRRDGSVGRNHISDVIGHEADKVRLADAPVLSLRETDGYAPARLSNDHFSSLSMAVSAAAAG